MIQFPDHSFSVDNSYLLHPLTTTTIRTSPFVGHNLPPDHTEVILRTHDLNNSWMMGVLLFIGLLVFLFLQHHHIKLLVLFRSAIDRRRLDQIMREGAVDRFNIYLESVFCYAVMLASILCYIVYQYAPSLVSIHSSLFILIAVACLTLAILLRSGLTLTLGNTLMKGDQVKHYMLNNQVYHFVGTIVMIPLVLLIYFSELHHAVLWISVSVLAILFVVRLIRGTQIILTNLRPTRFYLFYYLCIVEIVPLMIIAKFLVDYL